MGVERHHSELEEANAKIAALTRERDYLDEQVSRLQGALDARGRECAQMSEQLAIAVAAKNMMLQRMEQQQQLWRDRTDEILLRAAVDLNRQVRETGHALLCLQAVQIVRLFHFFPSRLLRSDCSHTFCWFSPTGIIQRSIPGPGTGAKAVQEPVQLLFRQGRRRSAAAAIGT